MVLLFADISKNVSNESCSTKWLPLHFKTIFTSTECSIKAFFFWHDFFALSGNMGLLVSIIESIYSDLFLPHSVIKSFL